MQQPWRQWELLITEKVMPFLYSYSLYIGIHACLYMQATACMHGSIATVEPVNQGT